MVGSHHDFRQRRGLQHVKPVVVGPRKVHVGRAHAGAFIHVKRRRNVNHAELFDAGRIVQRQPVCHTATPVMTAQKEVADMQRVHHRHHVMRHVALAVIAVIRQARRFR